MEQRKKESEETNSQPKGFFAKIENVFGKRK
jgi:hypothetical protein